MGRRWNTNVFNDSNAFENNIQQNLNALKVRRDRIQGKLLFRIFKNRKDRNRIKDLNLSILRLGVQLTQKNYQVNRLQNTITARNQTITNLNNQINLLQNALQEERKRSLLKFLLSRKFKNKRIEELKECLKYLRDSLSL